ncbi:MAG: phosphoglucomutase/phosphomannomutase family protein [Chloroflexi bacterium]|nr:phosphoglucomutase/phosphomannomutase family protein [Chloroflexota bacterium]
MSPIKFGTDGWRGIIAEDFTFDNVRVCAQAVADYLKQSGLSGRGLLIGYDTRFASEDFAAASAEVVAANDIKVLLSAEAVPTPVTSYNVLAYKTGGAIMITASHNPARWNGFKIKTAQGTSAPTEVIAAVEKNIARTLNTGGVKRMPLAEGLNRGLVEYIDPGPRYIEQVKRLIDLDGLRRARVKVVIDSMHGSGAGYLKGLLQGGNINLVEINGKRDALFGGVQPEPIARNLKKLSVRVREEKADVGLATDGDADRLGVTDEKGLFLTQLQVFALLALYLLEVRGERGAIVKTLTTTSMLYRLGELFKVPVHETRVGFKYVAPIMMAENALVGGEESGGYAFRGHVIERDGILAGLYFLDLVVKTGKTPSELIAYLYSKVGPHYYEREDVEFPEPQRQAIISRIADSPPKTIDGINVAKLDKSDGFRFILADASWLLIRFSGTEPVLRIYSETDSIARAKKLVELGKKMAGV